MQYIIARGFIAPIALLLPVLLNHHLGYPLKGMLILMQVQAYYFIY